MGTLAQGGNSFLELMPLYINPIHLASKTMSSFFYYFFNIALLTTAIAQIIPSPSIAQNNSIAKAQVTQTNMPICFIQTSDGKVRNLDSMCGYRLPDVCNMPIYLESEQSSLLADFCNKNQQCYLTNTCDKLPSSLSNPSDPTVSN